MRTATMPLSILIVDDNSRVRATIRSIISVIAGAISESTDGLDAIERYNAERPDVVLMDVSMPRLDGISALRRIRHLDHAARVVIVTDFDDPALRRAAADAGAIAYVTKDDLFALRVLLESL